jgi:hypothetical protein
MIMKKMMMIAAMMVATLSANAQLADGTFSLQPKVGLTLSEITANDARIKAGFTAGVEAQYQVNYWFGVAAGVSYAQQGTKVKSVDPKINLGYINVPIMAKFYPVKRLALGAGIQPGFMTSAKITDYQLLGGKQDVDIKDGCNKFDFSIPLSVAYEADFGLVIEARYNAGLTNVAKDAFEGGGYDRYDKITKNKNSVFMITVGYKFAL